MGKNWSTLQPHLISLALVVLIISIVSIVVFFKAKKQKPNQATKGILFFAETYVSGVETFFSEVTENKMKKPFLYMLTLFTFLLVGNLIGLLGFLPITTSYSVMIILALITWLGIYATGLIYNKWHWFKKFLHNPTEIVGQFSPFISLSFRMFGNILAGTIVMFFLYHVTGLIWEKIPFLGYINILGSFIAPAFHFYFDIFSGVIQAYVFVLLSMLYWTLEIEEENVSTKNI